jgi:EAL domain-containing protein (putative c-di-GMP-specific phosphodiesterase class I)
MLDNDADTLKAMQELREIGVYLSVDDFGTGYSPLGYLSRYPLNEMKIDRSFVLDSEQSENGARLITAIIAMARSLDLRILAAGVESDKQVLFLIEQGAHILQGYLFSKPVPPEELKVMLAPWHFMDQVQKILQSAGQTATERFLESNR